MRPKTQRTPTIFPTLLIPRRPRELMLHRPPATLQNRGSGNEKSRRILASVLTALVVLSAGTLGAVPAAPTALAAVVNGSTVSLTWTGPAGVVSAYVLEAGTGPGLSNAANAVVGVAPSYVATSVPAGVYFVRVRALGLDGVGPASNEVQVNVGGNGLCTQPPGAPQLAQPNISGNSVALAWTAAGGCAVESYSVLAGSAPTLSNVVIANVGAATSLATIAPTGTYFVRVVGHNAYGTSAPSNEVVASVGPFTAWSMAGTRSEKFAMPTTVRRVRIRANFPTLIANFVVVVNGRVIVNAVLGTGQQSTSYDAVHETAGGPVEVIASSGVVVPGGLPWSLVSVP